MKGMVMFDYADKYHIAIQEINILFSGENFGELVLKP
jgi:hypothetical protein